MKTPVIAHRKGFYQALKAGERHLWCSCGLSKTQPFCDGSHVGTDFLPVPVRPKVDQDVIFCGCKQTRTGPYCDGTHNNLPGGYREDDPGSPENQAVEWGAARSGPRTMLDGTCYVFSIRAATLTRRGAMAYCPVINPAMGARFQSQFYAEVAHGAAPVIGADGRHTILFMAEGRGRIDISGRSFDFGPRMGVYVRPDEAFQIHNTGQEVVRAYISNGPGSDDLTFLEAMPQNFEAALPNRCEAVDPAQRHEMAERYYQLLINRDHGSTQVTQFIGNIPLSKAEPHRHLYEEALIFLSGGGVVWTERVKLAVEPGDVLFLPSKQVHSVQCTAARGVDVVGVIHPGDNPSINY
jgi:mannose-6-phosphate isomerase-like protein (cupin superfamily)/CDGSH-type Zn-finger protein